MKLRRFRTRKLLAIGTLAALAPIAAPTPAHAAVAAAGPGASATGYATPVVVTAKGGPVTFVNGDIADHTLTSADVLPTRIARKTARCKAYGVRSCPIFWSGTVSSGGSAAVKGLGRVKPGRQYEFKCDIHSSMSGTLVVAGVAE